MSSTRYKVLLIEDDECDRMAFRRLVKKEELGYDYALADSVCEAQRILALEKFDVVVTDHELGDGTAFDVLDLIEETPVIFTTGAGDEKVAVKAMKAGAYDYLPKDIERNYLEVLPYVVENAVKHQKTKDKLKAYHNDLIERTEQLAAEKELLSVTLSSMGDAVIAVDVGKRITLFNKIAENLTKWKSEEARGKIVDEVFRIINEKTKAAVENPIEKVLSSGRIADHTDRTILIARDGSECPVSATAAPIRKSDATMLGVVMVLRDVSREQEIDRMKADFVSSVSHELRTPLTSVKACIATILRSPDMPDKTKREFYTTINNESNRLANLIENILDISTLESENARINLGTVDILSIVDQALSALKPLADKKNIQLRKSIDDEIHDLEGDDSKIQSVVMNLVNNAIKFTPERGHVSVSVGCEGEDVVMRVSDNGAGMPQEALPKIFDRFYRVHRPGKQIQGTGLGLAIVKEIVTMHGGRIEVESELDQGTTFSVFLPLCFEPMSEAATVN